MWPYPKIIAHRGGGSLAPENTLAAIQCGLNCGFHAIEFDVMLSKDLVPVVIHDEKLGRTVAGHGQVSQTLAADLLKLDAGSWFDRKFAASRVPTYQDILEFCAEHHIWMNVEIKPAKGFEVLTGEIVAKITSDFYRKKHFKQLPLFSSFKLEALKAAQRVAPQVPRALLLKRISSTWRADVCSVDAIAIHTNHKHLTLALCKEVKQAGIGLACYTVNDVARARTLEGWGVDAIFTDRLDLKWV